MILGAKHRFGPVAGVEPGIGNRGTVNLASSDFEPYYGGRATFGGWVFVSVRPAAMKMGAMHGQY